MHLGHVAAFHITKWLSDVFKVPLLIMISNGKPVYFPSLIVSVRIATSFAYMTERRLAEKYPRQGGGLAATDSASNSYQDIDLFTCYGQENAKDIVATGCDVEKTYIYLNQQRSPQFNWYTKKVSYVGFVSTLICRECPYRSC